MYRAQRFAGVRLIDGDRKFVGGPRNTAQHLARIRLTPEDLDYIEQYGSCRHELLLLPSIEYELPEMAKRCQVSFRFLRAHRPDYLARVCPYVTYAFFSGSHMTQEEIEALMDRCHALGTKVVGVTLGSRGSIFSEEGKGATIRASCPSRPSTRWARATASSPSFLTRRILGDGMEDAFRFAATAAANTCKFHGGFGYPHPLD